MKLSEYNQGIKDALQYISKFYYVHKGGKTFQHNIAEICHWLDENPQADKVKLLDKLAATVRKKPEEIRY